MPKVLAIFKELWKSDSQAVQKYPNLAIAVSVVWDAPRNTRQRLGPLALIKLGKRRFGGRDPMVSLAVLQYLEAPNRSGIGGFVSMSFALPGN